MTDMTFEISHNRGGDWPARPARGGHDARLAAHRREYCAYFALVLMLTLPLAVAVWTLTALRSMALPARGPLSAAWGQAAIITSIILSA